MQMGLFGGDLGKAQKGGFIRPGDIREFKEQGILVDEKKGVDAFRSRMKGITETFEDVAGGMSGAGRALVAQRITGIQNPVEALRAMGIVRRMMKVRLSELN